MVTVGSPDPLPTRLVVLHDADDVPLRVSKPGDRDLGFGDVGGRHYDVSTQLLGPVKICLGIIDLYVDDDGRLDGGVCGSHCAADARGTRLQQSVVGPPWQLSDAQLPAKQLVIEVAERAAIGSKDLEVHDRIAHLRKATPRWQAASNVVPWDG